MILSLSGRGSSGTISSLVRMTGTQITRLPEAGPEVETLLGALERVRRTFAWKCTGVDAEAMRTRLGPSQVTLGGLLKHLALVETHWFTISLHGRRPGDPWEAVDWDADPDWEWRSAADDTPEELVALWRTSVASSRAAVAEALAEGGLDFVARGSEWTPAPNLRRMLVDMNEEYARHTGHADLIRESIDGLVGEDAPEDVEV